MIMKNVIITIEPTIFAIIHDLFYSVYLVFLVCVLFGT